MNLFWPTRKSGRLRGIRRILFAFFARRFVQNSQATSRNEYSQSRAHSWPNAYVVNWLILMSVWGLALGGCGSKPAVVSVPPSIPTTVVAPSEAIEPAKKDAWFVDVAAKIGLSHEWPEQPRPMRTLEAFGCGCASFDSDNDGWQDVLVVADPHPKLFRNHNGTRFEEVTEASGLNSLAGNWIGCAVADYNGDGLLDVLLTGFHQLALYKNDGNLHFSLVTEQAGLDPANHGHWGASAGFMDLDGDNLLDLVIVNYVEYGPNVKQYCYLRGKVKSGCPPKEYVPERAEIWRNDGQGKFVLVPDGVGLQTTNGVCLVLAFTDLDHDGRMDFYIGNDGTPAELLHNQGGMKFDNIGIISGIATDNRGGSLAAMGVDWGDYDRDGVLDLTVSNFQELCFVVFRGMGDKFFIDNSIPVGLANATRHRLGFGTKWVDFENDGWPDIFFVNGHVYDNVADIEGPSVPYRQPPLLMQNRQGKEFVDIAVGMGEDVLRPMVGRGSATMDFNNDGQIDLLGVDYEGPVMLLENQSETKNHWITFDLRAAAPNVFAYGAHLAAKAKGQVWVGEVSPASSYLSSSDPRVHWGLGDVDKLDELTIRWPNGKTQTLKDVKVDQILRLTQEP